MATLQFLEHDLESPMPETRPDTHPAWTATVTVPRRHLAAFESALTAAADTGAGAVSVDYAAGDLCRVEALVPAGSPRAGVEAAAALAAAACGIAPPAVAWAPLPRRDWVAAGLAALVPVRAGRFRLRGGHHAAGPSIWELRLDAGAAFGTGHHETTRGCLEALDALARRRRFARPIDMGCGSGVLALAMARLWRCRVIAVDNDPAAVAVARANAALNGLARAVSCRTGDGFAACRRGERYDLIAANILARPLAAMAPALARRLEPGGVAVLSGLLRAQAPPLLAACRRQGLVLERRHDVGEWSTPCVSRPR